MHDMILMSPHDDSKQDVNPNGIGKFGLEKTNPIPIYGIDNIPTYMDKLRYKYVSKSGSKSIIYNHIDFIRTSESDNSENGSKKPEVNKVEDTSSKDLALITQMNNELAGSLDLKETLQNALEVIIKRINAQAANVFFIEEKKQVFQCIASKYQAYLEDFEPFVLFGFDVRHQSVHVNQLLFHLAQLRRKRGSLRY